MRAGSFKEIFTFQECREQQGATGFVSKLWMDVFTCKGMKKKQTASPGDEMNASEVFIENTVIFQTYRYPSINDTQRIRWNGATWRIVLLDPQAFDNSYLITCKKENE